MFIQVGRWLIAIDKIVSINLNDTSVNVYEQGDETPWTFTGEEAEVVRQWAKHHTKVLLAPDGPPWFGGKEVQTKPLLQSDEEATF